MQIFLMEFLINNKNQVYFCQKMMVFPFKLIITFIKEIKIKKSSEFQINF